MPATWNRPDAMPVGDHAVSHGADAMPDRRVADAVSIPADGMPVDTDGVPAPADAMPLDRAGPDAVPGDADAMPAEYHGLPRRGRSSG